MTSNTRTIRRTGILAVAVGIVALATAACAPPPAPEEVVQPAQTIDTSNGLVVNGEQIADQQLWDAAVAEGSINLYTGYTENTEAALLKQFEADTGIKVNVVRLTPNRLFERIFAEYGAGKLKADSTHSRTTTEPRWRDRPPPVLPPGSTARPNRGHATGPNPSPS